MSKHALPCLALTLLLAGPATARDLPKVAPCTAKVAFENASIRVIRLHCAPGASTPMRSHPPRVVITVKPATLKLSKPDGSSVVIPADQQARPTALDACTDIETDIGTKPGEYIEVEFKRHAHLGKLWKSPLENPADPNSLLHEPHHHWMMGTSWFRVVEARIPPGVTTLWHRHSYSTIVVQEKWCQGQFLRNCSHTLFVAPPFRRELTYSGYGILAQPHNQSAKGGSPALWPATRWKLQARTAGYAGDTVFDKLIQQSRWYRRAAVPIFFVQVMHG